MLESLGGSPSAFESNWQHWTVKRSLCALTVLTRGSICLWVSLVFDNIEQWRDHSVLWQCWMGGPSVSKSVTTLNSEEITLCSDSVECGGPSAFGVCIFIYALVCPYISFLVDCFEWAFIYIIEQRKVHSVLWQFQMGGFHLPLMSVSLYMHWYFLRSYY